MPPAPERARAGSTRRDPIVLVAVALVLLAARVATGMYESKHPPDRPDEVTWVDPEVAGQASSEDHKPILYDFTAEWSGASRALQREVFADQQNAHALGRLVVPVRVVDRQREDGRNDPVVDSLLKAYGVTEFPTLVVVADGKVVDRRTGYSDTPTTTLRWIAGAASKARLSDSTDTGIRLRFH